MICRLVKHFQYRPKLQPSYMPTHNKSFSNYSSTLGSNKPKPRKEKAIRSQPRIYKKLDQFRKMKLTELRNDKGKTNPKMNN